ncbi:hypothetical protein Q5752_005167 [Cryptotrichosporon argae]
MSKPKPGLGKGIARTLVHSARPTASTAAATPPHLALAAPAAAHAFSSLSSFLPILPLWDSTSTSLPSAGLDHASVPGPSHRRDSIVSYFSPSKLARAPPVAAMPPPGVRAYTSSSNPARAAVDALASFSSLSFDRVANKFDLPDLNVLFADLAVPPPSSSPPPPSPHLKPRPSAPHAVLSPIPLGPPTPSPSPSPFPFYARPNGANAYDLAPPPRPEPHALSLYSSNLIFHLGASGSAKDRPPVSSRQRLDRLPPPPPRTRSFALPVVPPPTTLRSVRVGEDAYFVRSDGMCVADGVGGWARRGGADASRWSLLLTHFCEEEVGRWWAGASEYVVADPAPDRRADDDAGRRWTHIWVRDRAGAESEDVGLEAGKKRRPLDPVEIMQRGYEKCLACITAEGVHGSSTCLLALLHHSTLLVANLGDCGLLVIRRGEVVFRTSEMQHAFNFPLQLGTHSRDEPMKDAKRYDFGVEKEDVVVVGSDGLMDNLFDEDILETLAEFAPPSTYLPTPLYTLSGSSRRPSATAPAPGALPPFSPQQVSEALCRRARAVSEQATAATPFMLRAIEEGIEFVGGKRDDISVLVGVVGDGERRAGEGLALRT